MSTWSVKYPLSIIVGGDTKQSGFTKVKDEFTSIYSDLSTHAHDGTADNGDKISMSNITQDAGFTTGGNLVVTGSHTVNGVLNETKGANIASAGTINLTTATGNLIHITGTTGITTVTLGSGMRRTVIFDGALTLTHHATNNNLPGGANITTAAGDRADYWSDGTTVYCTNYSRVSDVPYVPPGTVIWFAANAAPTGYLKANGAAISRTTYAVLFAAIGTVFGTGDGSTTFNLPDLRGEFLRGWDDSKGVDTGRTFGSAQTDEIESHVHRQNIDNTANVGAGTSPKGSAQQNPASDSGMETDAYGGTETRPRNIALLACIKY